MTHDERHLGTEPLAGRWSVVRRSGLLPPAGVTKRIGTSAGWTYVFGLPVARFDVRGAGRHRRLHYRLLPVVDHVARAPDGTWEGRATVFGVEFCRFRLVPRDRRPPDPAPHGTGTRPVRDAGRGQDGRAPGEEEPGL